MAIIIILQKDIEVTYTIEYNETCSNVTGSNSVQVKVPKKDTTALNVMEQAVTDNGEDYRFSATYYGEELGYFIDTINGTSSDVDNACFWFFYTISFAGEETLSPVGVSNANIKEDESAVVWRFQPYQPHE